MVDDEAYLDRVTNCAAKLVTQGKLVPARQFRSQIGQKSLFTSRSIPQSSRKLSPTDLHDRLRLSTLAVGPFYRCTECSDWHFNAGTGFVAAEDGVVSTCCHVLDLDEDEMKDAYIIAADSDGRVYPVTQVLAADPDSDTCLLKIEAPALKPLPLRKGVRTGERVYCMSHPGGNHFMFTEGMVSRVMRSRNEVVTPEGATNRTRLILYLNITAEFAPGSSGAPVVDECGNVVGQVTSIADAGEPLPQELSDTAPAVPSVPVRFCIAGEEIAGLWRETRSSSGSKSKENSSSARSKTGLPESRR